MPGNGVARAKAKAKSKAGEAGARKRCMSSKRVTAVRSQLGASSRLRAERRLLQWIMSKLKRDLSLVWSVEDLLSGGSAPKDGKFSKPLNRNIVYVQGTNNKNGLGQWVICAGLAACMRVNETTVNRIKLNVDVLRLLQWICGLEVTDEIPRITGQTPHDVIDWLKGLAAPMLPVILSLEWPEDMSSVDWNFLFGAFRLVCSDPEEPDIVDSVMHVRSRTVIKLDKKYHVCRVQVPNVIYIENNHSEEQATLKSKRVSTAIQLAIEFGKVVEEMGCSNWDIEERGAASDGGPGRRPLKRPMSLAERLIQKAQRRKLALQEATAAGTATAAASAAASATATTTEEKPATLGKNDPMTPKAKQELLEMLQDTVSPPALKKPSKLLENPDLEGFETGTPKKKADKTVAEEEAADAMPVLAPPALVAK